MCRYICHTGNLAEQVECRLVDGHLQCNIVDGQDIFLENDTKRFFQLHGAGGDHADRIADAFDIIQDVAGKENCFAHLLQFADQAQHIAASFRI